MACPDELVAPRPIGWGVVGPGEIAGVFARALARSGVGVIKGVLGRTQERTQAYADRYGGRVARSLDDLLAMDNIGAVYIATPHPMHAEAAGAALKAYRAVLCEKPMTTDAQATGALVSLSRATRTPLVEAWMYRTHPQIARAIELVQRGVIGRVRRIEAGFGVACEDRTPERLRSPALGGGVIYDIGGYPLSAVTMLVRALGHGLESVALGDAQGQLIDTGVEIDAEASLSIAGEIPVRVSCSFRRALGLFIEIECEAGTISLPSAFLPGGDREGTLGEITITDSAGSRTTERLASDHCCYSMEAIEVARLISTSGSEPVWPMVGHDESIAIASLVDTWRCKVLETERPADKRLQDRGLQP